MTRAFSCVFFSLTFLLHGLALGDPRARKPVRPGPTKVVKASPVKAKAKPAKPQTQRMSFDDDFVEAGRAGGGGMLIKGRVKPKHSKLIPIRVDFVPELIKSANFI